MCQDMDGLAVLRDGVLGKRGQVFYHEIEHGLGERPTGNAVQV